MPRENRLDRIYGGLTALERAKLVLKTYHDDTREDPGWRQTMPQRQVHAFNEHIYLMNAANLYVAQMINGLDADLQLLWERWLRLVTLARWSQDIADGPSGPRVAQRAPQHSTGVSVPAGPQEELDDAIEVLAESVRPASPGCGPTCGRSRSAWRRWRRPSTAPTRSSRRTGSASRIFTRNSVNLTIP